MGTNRTIQFISPVRKGNNKGAGFISMPNKAKNLFNCGERVRVELPAGISFFAKIGKANERIGIYIPRGIALKNNLIQKEVAVQITKVDGFYSRISTDGRICIPRDIVKEQKLKQNDIVFIKGMEGDKVLGEKYSKITVVNRPKRDRMEYSVIFDQSFCGRKILFQLENETCSKGNIITTLRKALEGMHYALVDDYSLIIFNGNKMPAIINSRFRYSDIALYLGAYFADGTKKGNSWAICASTFEQANFYWEMHKFLIKDSNPEFTISYTDINNEKYSTVIDQLKKAWEEKTNIKLNKFRILKTASGESHSKHNQYGTLIIREHKQILLDFYNSLLKVLIDEIISKKNKKLAFDFLCGVIEGDGCAPAKKRGHISVALDRENSDILENIVKVTGIEFKIVKEGENKYFLRIGALEILRNFFYFEGKLFALYPKRKEKLLERLKTVGAVKYLTENHKPVSWVRTWFLKNGFIDKSYKFTTKGLRLRKAFKNLYGN